MTGNGALDLDLSEAYDELFMDEKTREENRLPKLREIPLAEIDDFPDHPYQVREDEDMAQLVESIKERGVITPVILRQKEDGRYEMISGHRRKRACQLAGLETVKSHVVELTRDEAIILMVDSNLQRTVILPSEKAFAYKMRLDAMKRQAGRPRKENASPVETHLRTSEVIAQATGDSRAQIDRYIRLTNLIPGLLNLVDERKIAFRPGVELSYLTEKEQSFLLETAEYLQVTPSHAQAIRLKELSKEGRLNQDVIYAVMSEEKPNQKEKISFPVERLKKYIPQSVPASKTQDYVLQALQFFQEHGKYEPPRSKGGGERK